MSTTRKQMDYSQGKIYKIEPIAEHDEGDIYIGSSCCNYLSQRLRSHRDCYKRWKEGKRHLTTSYNIFDKYGLDNCKILLLENVSCDNINELRAREAYYIRTLKCVNKNIPLRTLQEWYDENEEKEKEKRQAYYEANKEKIAKKQKTYRYKNPDKTKEEAKISSKKYYEKNKDAINEKQRLKRQAKRDEKNNIST